jgi:hypothetical protein
LSSLSEEEKRVPWTNHGVKHIVVFSLCAKCCHGKTRYHIKRQIETKNKVEDRSFWRDMKEYEATVVKGKKVTPSKQNEELLQVAYCF